ncbi:hypothetical protein H4Q32_026653 [Labeo rohita]|uniref:Uncharacterized protein n=1 Tax=Labeo rohita TaxID=84645 RepID=A0ABQ8L235_LABRO|nr:hypothetical protein H4Q32_026653 [Labeo rohita]
MVGQSLNFKMQHVPNIFPSDRKVELSRKLLGGEGGGVVSAKDPGSRLKPGQLEAQPRHISTPTTRPQLLGVFDLTQRCAARSNSDLKQCIPVRNFVRLEAAPTPRDCHVLHQTAFAHSTVLESFADYIEWVLVSCRSSLTAEDDTSPTQDPEPSQPAPRHAEFEPEPTADDEPEPRATESKIATEPEPYTSDQVREPATITMTGDCKMEQVRAMESPAHCTTAGGELENDSGDLIDFSTEALENNSGDLIDFFTEISTCHVIPACMESPPTLPLLPMSTSVCAPLSPDSPSAHPQSSTCAVGSPRVCQLPSASGLEDPSSPPPASESRTPPRPSNPAAPPRLSAPSSPLSPIGPPAPPGSFVFSAPPWSVVVPPSPQASSLRPTGSYRLLPPSGTASILCRSGSAADLRISAYALVARA